MVNIGLRRRFPPRTIVAPVFADVAELYCYLLTLGQCDRLMMSSGEGCINRGFHLWGQIDVFQ